MRITHESDYAIRIVHLLMNSPQQVSAREIARRTGIPPRFALKILRKLLMKGILRSGKGVQGGYALVEGNEDISIGQVIEVIDGPILLSHCLTDEFECTRVENKASCRFHATFERVCDTLRKQLYDEKIKEYGMEEHT